MKNIKLKFLDIKNFKGCSEFRFIPDGSNSSVYGDNGTGKTTLYDAFCWLITGKDSAGKQDAQIKPVDSSGEEIHNLDVEVSGILDVDGSEISIRRILSEDWTRKTGSPEKNLTGHTTKYFINDVPKKQKDFDKILAEIIPKEIFRTITDPFYFADGMKWEDRRKIVLEVGGAVNDQDVIDSKSEFDFLSDILKKMSISEYKKSLNDDRKKIGEEKESIPVRISELKRKESPPPIDIKEKERLQKKLEKETENLHGVLSGFDITEKQAEINKLRETSQDVLIAREKIQKEIESLFEKLGVSRSAINNKKILLDDTERLFLISLATRDDLRKQWDLESQKSFSCVDVCPTCEQGIPEEKIEESKNNFNLAKSTKLETIKSEGAKITACIKEKEAEIEKINSDIYRLKQDLASIESEIEKKNKELSGIKTTVDTASIEKLEQKKRAIQMDIDAKKNGVNIRAAGINDDILKIQEQLDVIAVIEAKHKAMDEDIKRISELEKQESELSAQWESILEKINIVNRFNRAWVEMSEGAINQKFKIAKFKMFYPLINGEFKECCEVLNDKGVPFGRGLNNGACYNLGLDIIDTLSSHYGVSMPIFIDNAEGVTDIQPTIGQQIRLIVKTGQNELLMEKN